MRAPAVSGADEERVIGRIEASWNIPKQHARTPPTAWPSPQLTSWRKAA